MLNIYLYPKQQTTSFAMTDMRNVITWRFILPPAVQPLNRIAHYLISRYGRIPTKFKLVRLLSESSRLEHANLFS